MTLFLVTFVAFIGFSCGDQGVYNENGEYIFQQYLRWNYTYMNPGCASPSGRNPCQDIRACQFAGASLSMGGWPTLCGWVGARVPKVCCGLPLVLGPTLMKKVDSEISRKRECGKTTYDESVSKTLNKFFENVRTRPKVDISDPNKFDPPLDLSSPSMISSLSPSMSRQGEFPWMVSVQKDGRHICDGTLISRKHILTAAHCVADDMGQYSVLVGNLHFDDGYPINVTKIRIHPAFDAETKSNNLGLLTLDQEILTPSIPHICLPLENSTPEGDGTLLQWERVIKDGNKKLKLCVTEPFKVAPIQNCFKNGQDSIPLSFLKNYICVEKIGNSRKCGKSTGGPLMLKNNFGSSSSSVNSPSWSIIGLNTQDAEDSGSPYALFTYVSSFTNWIQTIKREDSSPNNIRYE